MLMLALSVLSISIGFFWVCFLLFIRATFCVTSVCVCMCSVSWLFWFSYQYLPCDWLERLLWGRLFAVRRLSPQSPNQRLWLRCVVSLFLLCVCPVPPGPTHYISYSYSLFLLKEPLNANQPTNQSTGVSHWASCEQHRVGASLEK